MLAVIADLCRIGKKGGKRGDLVIQGAAIRVSCLYNNVINYKSDLFIYLLHLGAVSPEVRSRAIFSTNYSCRDSIRAPKLPGPPLQSGD